MESFWQSRTEIPEFSRLSGDAKTDVLVIGGGLAGVLTAYCLQKKGIDTLLVEKDRICSAVTAGTTAKITAQHGLIYHKIMKSYGEEYAKMYYTANAKAVEMLKKLCRNAECRLEDKDNFVYSTDEALLEKELSALRKLNIPAKCKQELPFGIKAAGAVGFVDQGQFDPLALAKCLTKELNIHERTKVTELIGTRAVTEFGTVRAKKIVVATHFPFINKHGSYFLKLYQHRSYMLALSNVDGLDAMYVDEDKKGLSLSSFGDVVLLGGGSHRTGKQGGSYQKLREFTQRHMPSARENFHWATQDTMSLDGIPYIGQYSKNTPDLYVATGFNKWGMTGSMVSARLLSGMIAGETVDYVPVFSPSRSILKPQLLVNSVESVKNLLTPTAPRCPHLGCALHYNKEEHSWDCACHGSRFSEDGTVLDNPATTDLKRK